MIPVPKQGTPRDNSLTPITLMVVDTMGLKKSRALLKGVLWNPKIVSSINVLDLSIKYYYCVVLFDAEIYYIDARYNFGVSEVIPCDAPFIVTEHLGFWLIELLTVKILEHIM